MRRKLLCFRVPSTTGKWLAGLLFHLLSLRESARAKDRTSTCKAFGASQGEERSGAVGDSMTLFSAAIVRAGVLGIENRQ